MLTEQKRYLYLLYIILSCGCGCIFGLFELLFLLPGYGGGSMALPYRWLLCYLFPVVIFLPLFARWFWFDSRQAHVTSLGTLPLSGILAPVGILVGVGLWSLNGLPYAGSYILSLAMLPILKKSLILLVKRSSPESNLIKSVAIVGTGEHARYLSSKINRHPEYGMRIVGFLADSQSDVGRNLSGHPVLGTPDSIGKVLTEHIVDIILLVPEKGEGHRVDTIVQRCRLEGVDVGVAASRRLPESSRWTVERMEDMTFWILSFVKRDPAELFLKRCIDLVLSVVAFCLCLPAWVIVPILIRFDSPGPILFRQTRVGKNGRRFTMFKFRSMVTDAESRREQLIHLNEMDGPAFKIKEDPRVTRIGAFLRKTSLDELPQLFNVIRGDISLVGPRPPLFEEVRQYRPWEKRRLSVLQGISGLWQISGRSELKFDEWMKLDLMYIDQWRFSLDMLIILKTIPAVIARKGAQ